MKSAQTEKASDHFPELAKIRKLGRWVGAAWNVFRFGHGPRSLRDAHELFKRIYLVLKSDLFSGTYPRDLRRVLFRAMTPA